MPRVLLLMTTRTYRAGAFLAAARSLGLDITVASDEPQAVAFANPLGHLVVDPTDVATCVPAILGFARTTQVDAILAVDDDGAVAAATASAALGLRHASPEAVRTCRDKHATRMALARAGRVGPWFAVHPPDADPRAIAPGVPYPCVLKPTGLSASRGVIRADDAESFVAAFERVARIVIGAGIGARGEILIESYLPGTEVALEGLLVEGELEVLAIFDKPDPLEGPLFEETIYVTPSRLPGATRRAVALEVAESAQALGLDLGPVHAELRVDAGGPRLVEIAPRSIGGLCSRVLRFEGGHSLEALILKAALGEDVHGLERERPAAGVMMIPIPRAGVLEALSGIEQAHEVGGIEEIRITIPIGDRLVPLPEGSRYLGFIFARAADPERVESALREAHQMLHFDISDAEVAAVTAEAPVERGS